jgi:hypothetical protein
VFKKREKVNMSEPIKICIQRAATRKEWDEMQADYIRRALLSADHIEKLETALREIAEAVGDPSAYWIARKAREGKDDVAGRGHQ